MWNSDTPAGFRANHFGTLRFALAALVVVGHSFSSASGTYAGEPFFEFTGRKLDLGQLAVDGFFIASGFMVSESLARGRGIRDFMRKRILRLYPAFAVLWLLQAFVIAPLFSAESFHGYSLKQLGILLFNLVTLTGYGYPYGGLLTVFPDNPIPRQMNVSLWTLRYEFGCYAGLALLGSAGLFRRRWLMTSLFSASWLLMVSGVSLPWNRVLTALLADGLHWPRFATYFLAGATFWHWRKEIPRNPILAATAALAMFVGFRRAEWLAILLPAGWTYLLMWLAYLPTKGAGDRTGAPVDVSYGTYLYAFPIQQMTMVLLPRSNGWTVLAISLPATVLAGFASWHLVEKHFLRSRSAAAPTKQTDPPPQNDGKPGDPCSITDSHT